MPRVKCEIAFNSMLGCSMVDSNFYHLSSVHSENKTDKSLSRKWTNLTKMNTNGEKEENKLGWAEPHSRIPLGFPINFPYEKWVLVLGTPKSWS